MRGCTKNVVDMREHHWVNSPFVPLSNFQKVTFFIWSKTLDENNRSAVP